MRFVIYGAGAIGGLMGGCLYQAGHRVELIARGRHLAAIQDGGLVLERQDQRAVLPIPAVPGPDGLDWDEPAVVVLAMKSQDTEAALDALEAAAPPDTTVVCAQNGVANERRALRRFANTYGLWVMCPATHLEPGVVHGHSAPISGLMDLGRYPGGSDDTAAAVAGALGESTFQSMVRPDIMRWKYRKLLTNLANAVEALCGPGGRGGDLTARAVAEAEAVLATAGIDVATADEDVERRGDLLQMSPHDSRQWAGGSSWQSVTRGTGTVEADFLNGEIALLGRLSGVPTPVNAFLQHRAGEAARAGRQPGHVTAEQLLAELDAGAA